jgi:hypothetical protein
MATSTVDIITSASASLKSSGGGAVTVATGGNYFSSTQTIDTTLVSINYIKLEDKYGKRFQNRTDS